MITPKWLSVLSRELGRDASRLLPFRSSHVIIAWSIKTQSDALPRDDSGGKVVIDARQLDNAPFPSSIAKRIMSRTTRTNAVASSSRRRLTTPPDDESPRRNPRTSQRPRDSQAESEDGGGETKPDLEDEDDETLKWNIHNFVDVPVGSESLKSVRAVAQRWRAMLVTPVLMAVAHPQVALHVRYVEARCWDWDGEGGCMCTREGQGRSPSELCCSRQLRYFGLLVEEG